MRASVGLLRLYGVVFPLRAANSVLLWWSICAESPGVQAPGVKLSSFIVWLTPFVAELCRSKWLAGHSILLFSCSWVEYLSLICEDKVDVLGLDVSANWSLALPLRRALRSTSKIIGGMLLWVLNYARVHSSVILVRGSIHRLLCILMLTTATCDWTTILHQSVS